MKNLFIVCLLSFFMVCSALSATAQRTSNDWRVTKKERTVSNGQKFVYEYSYSSDGRIQSVKYYSATGILTITISDFKFDRNGKPSFYTVTYNRENATVNVNLSYDNNRRLTRLEKTLEGKKDKTVFNYRYSGNTITVIEEIAESDKGSDNSMSYYTDNGDYTETTGDAASRTIKSVSTLKSNPIPSPENEPDKFYGGYEAPGFLGISANGTDPEIVITKNENGFIATRTITKRNGVDKSEFTYSKINRAVPVAENPATTIQTNINCEQGKKIVERLLGSQDGVKTVTIDIRTGKLTLDYSTDGTSYTQIISLINDAGFDADRGKSQKAENNPCAQKKEPAIPITRQAGPNIFDARKGFAKVPIKFVPFVVTADAAQKGFKADSIYRWTAPDGKQKVASGAEILKQVNEMELELSYRGRTLRQKNTFNALSYKLIDPKALLKKPPVVPKTTKLVKLNTGPGIGIKKFPIVKTKHNNLKDISSKFATTIGGDVGVYFGSLTAGAEFQGIIGTTGTVDNSKCLTQCPLDLTLSLDGKMIKSLNIKNCVLEISANPNRKPNDNEVPLATANFNFQTPARTKYGTENMTITGDAPPSFHTLYYFPVKLSDLSKLPRAVVKPVLYYAYVKFYNDKGELLYYSSYNTAVLENQIQASIFIPEAKNVSGKFDDALLDPTGLFGMYYKSNNLSASYSTKRDDATLVITENTKLAGDIEIGAQYYNFWYLLDNDKPKYERKSFISANFSSEYINRYGIAPQIRRPGEKKSNDMNNFTGYQVNYSLNDGESNKDYNKSSELTEHRGVGYNIFNERFFIGPVPCVVTVDVKGNVSITRKSTMDTLTNGNVSMSTSITPHMDLTLSGEGGVDAGIVYAKVVANVKVIEVDFPMSAKAGKNADIQADIILRALSGEIYFTAGLCIPIPWFDDICTDFRIDIFNWKGPSENYPLIK